MTDDVAEGMMAPGGPHTMRKPTEGATNARRRKLARQSRGEEKAGAQTETKPTAPGGVASFLRRKRASRYAGGY